MYGGFIYFHERKEVIFFKFNLNKLVLCNEFQIENIKTHYSLINKNKIYKEKIYGYIEYNKNYKLIQRGLVLKIKRETDKRGSIFISSSSSEWTSNSGIKFIKKRFLKDWKSINDRFKEEIEEQDYNSKYKINKIKLGVLIELLLRKNNKFIQGDILWLYKI